MRYEIAPSMQNKEKRHLLQDQLAKTALAAMNPHLIIRIIPKIDLQAKDPVRKLQPFD
jgi:hypothetical protein